MSNTPGGDTTLKRLQVVLTGNTKQIQQAMSQAQQVTAQTESRIKGSMDKVGATLKKIGAVAAAALSVKAIVGFGKSCIDLGSDLAEVQNVVNVTFGDMRKQVDSFAKGAIKQFGLSETAAKRYTSTMGAMLKSMGITTKQAYTMSTSMTGLAGDMASFYNLDAETAFEKIRAGISGETEPLKQLGINMSVANLEAYALSQGIKASYSEMSQAEQAMLRYNYLLSVTADAQGDFARTSTGWANQTRILAMQFDSLKASIGQGLVMAFTPVLKVINTVLSRLQVLADKFKSFMTAITGQSAEQPAQAAAAPKYAQPMALDIKPSEDVAKNAEKTAKASDKAGKAMTNGMRAAAKEASGVLAPFDELNKLGGGSYSSGMIDTPEIDTGALDVLSDSALLPDMEQLVDTTAAENLQLQETQTQAGGVQSAMDKVRDRVKQVVERAKELAGIFGKGFEAGSGGQLPERLKGILGDVQSIGQHVKEIFTDPAVNGAASTWAERVSYAAGQVLGAGASIATTVGSAVVGGIESYLASGKERIKRHLVSMFDISGAIASTAGKLSQSVAAILEPLGGQSGQNAVGNIIGIFTEAAMSITEIMGKAARDIYNFFAAPIVLNTAGLQGMVDDIVGFVEDATANVRQMFNDIGDGLNAFWDEHIRPLIDSITRGVSDIIGIVTESWATYVSPVLDMVGEKVRVLWSEHMKPAFDSFLEICGIIVDVIRGIWEYIKPFVDWIVKYVVDGVLAQLSLALQVVIDVLGYLWDAISGVMDILKGLLEFVVGVFTGDWEKAWDGIVDVVFGLGKAVDAIAKGIASAVFGLCTMIAERIEAVVGRISDAVGNFFLSIGKFFGLVDDDAVWDTRTNWNTTAAEAQAMDSLRGSAKYAMMEGQLGADDIQGAMSAALNDVPQKDTNIYIDGEKVASTTDRAKTWQNTRYNPVYT